MSTEPAVNTTSAAATVSAATPVPAAERPWAYSAFRVTVSCKRQVSPRFVRITLVGDDLRNFAPWGLDQRIKLVLPMPDGSQPEFGLLDQPTPPPSYWYGRWKTLPEAERNVLRTYTPAAVRPDVGEVDVDIYLHQPSGPASSWAQSCTPGDALVITGPDTRAGYTGYGIHFTPPEPPGRLLLIGDATALPAMNNILAARGPGVASTGGRGETGDAGRTPAEVILELADPADNTLPDDLPDTRVHVVAQGATPGSALDAAVRAWGRCHGSDRTLESGAYAWIAGEGDLAARTRRYLTRELGWPKDRVAFMAYWHHGGRPVE